MSSSRLARATPYVYIAPAVIEDGHIALDETITLARPRSQGNATFAAIEKRILDRVLQKPAHQPVTADPHWPGPVANGLRWAI